MSELEPKYHHGLLVNKLSLQLHELYQYDRDIVSSERPGLRPCRHYLTNLLGTLILHQHQIDAKAVLRQLGVDNLPSPLWTVMDDQEFGLFSDLEGKKVSATKYPAPRVLVKNGFGLHTGLVISGEYAGAVLRRDLQKRFWGLERVLNDLPSTAPDRPNKIRIVQPNLQNPEIIQVQDKFSEAFASLYTAFISRHAYLGDALLELMRLTQISADPLHIIRHFNCTPLTEYDIVDILNRIIINVKAGSVEQLTHQLTLLFQELSLDIPIEFSQDRKGAYPHRFSTLVQLDDSVASVRFVKDQEGLWLCVLS